MIVSLYGLLMYTVLHMMCASLSKMLAQTVPSLLVLILMMCPSSAVRFVNILILVYIYYFKLAETYSSTIVRIENETCASFSGKSIIVLCALFIIMCFVSIKMVIFIRKSIHFAPSHFTTSKL